MLFQAKELTKSFGDNQVLKGVSFSVESGTAIGLLGRNGAGKTTTIRMIMGVFSGGGEILVDGEPIDREKINFGYLPEERGLYPKKKILEQLEYFGTLRGMRRSEARKNAMKWLRRFEMEQYANKKLDTLSKGNQQKIQLACALVTDPEFIILDEPFSGLDPVNAKLLRDVVAELIADGRIVMFSSHQMNYVEEFCSKIAVLNDGRIAVEGSIRDIKRSHDRRKMVVETVDCANMKAAIQRQLSDIISSVSLEEGSIVVTLNSEQDKGQFMSRLVQLGVDFDAVRVLEPTLEEIFVEYTEVRS